MNDESHQQQPEKSAEQEKHGFWSVTKAVLAAAIGVQTNKNREKDFQHGNPLAFIIGGVIFTLLFILTIATVVGFVLRK